MSITKELRKYAEELETAASRKSEHGFSPVAMKLTAIADRIDAEHEKAVRERRRSCVFYDPERHYCSYHDFDVSGYVELPKDAGGEYIHAGDVLTDGEYTFRVDELAAFGDGSWSIRNEDGNAWAACDVTHHHAPTVEDVLRDMHMELDEVTALYVGEAIDSDERDRDEARIFAKYASKLRLAGEDA